MWDSKINFNKIIVNNLLHFRKFLPHKDYLFFIFILNSIRPESETNKTQKYIFHFFYLLTEINLHFTVKLHKISLIHFLLISFALFTCLILLKNKLLINYKFIIIKYLLVLLITYIYLLHCLFYINIYYCCSLLHPSFTIVNDHNLLILTWHTCITYVCDIYHHMWIEEKTT